MAAFCAVSEKMKEGEGNALVERIYQGVEEELIPGDTGGSYAFFRK